MRIPLLDEYPDAPADDPEYMGYGPLNLEVVAATRHRLHAWCKDQNEIIALGPQEICEAIMPALDAMLDLYGVRP